MSSRFHTLENAGVNETSILKIDTFYAPVPLKSSRCMMQITEITKNYSNNIVLTTEDVGKLNKTLSAWLSSAKKSKQ